MKTSKNIESVVFYLRIILQWKIIVGLCLQTISIMSLGQSCCSEFYNRLCSLFDINGFISRICKKISFLSIIFYFQLNETSFRAVA